MDTYLRTRTLGQREWWGKCDICGHYRNRAGRKTQCMYTGHHTESGSVWLTLSRVCWSWIWILSLLTHWSAHLELGLARSANYSDSSVLCKTTCQGEGEPDSPHFKSKGKFGFIHKVYGFHVSRMCVFWTEEGNQMAKHRMVAGGFCNYLWSVTQCALI